MMESRGTCLALKSDNSCCQRSIYFKQYPFCKIHKKYRFSSQEMKNLKNKNICPYILQTGKKKGKCCSKILKKNEEFCYIHKRVAYGVCYKKNCNNTSMKKNYTCEFHSYNHPCPCSKHNFDSNIKKSFHIVLPMDVIIYKIFPMVNNISNIRCVSKRFINFMSPFPIQINLSREILAEKISSLLKERESTKSRKKEILIVKNIYNIICQNIHFLQDNEKFKKIAILKIKELSRYIDNWKYYYNIMTNS